jgi:Kdo2-lipid IVA lauroyltransferase/acyltransferase
VTQPTYSFRPGRFARERTYRLAADGFEWQEGRRRGYLAYADIAKVDVCKERFLGSSASYWRCILRPGSGGAIRLGAASRRGLRGVEDRTATYIPFIKALETRIAAASPHRIFTTSEPWLNRVEEWGGRVVVWSRRAIRHANPDRCADVAAWLLRRLGPWLRGHRMARSQLAAAFPEKSAAEIENILRGMWDNLARTAIEYSQLDRLWDHGAARPGGGRIVVDQASEEVWSRILADQQPCLGFAAHLANWELAAVAMSVHGRPAAIPIRTPKTRALADELIRVRKQAGITPILAGPDAMIEIRKAINHGALVGMLVDQHNARGIEVMFFGRRCKMNPIFVRLARMFDAHIYGARVVRLPDRRFGYEVIGPIDAVRDDSGKIDIAATMQVIASIIEGWIREHPEQWMWLHRMWR